MDTKSNGSGNPFGPDQRNNPHRGINEYQWEESGSGEGESTVRLGSENEGNTERRDLNPSGNDVDDDANSEED